jgi:hypothetical protein
MKVNAAAEPLTTRQLSTPRTAAVAGILFAVLFGTALVLIGVYIPATRPMAAPGCRSGGAR